MISAGSLLRHTGQRLDVFRTSAADWVVCLLGRFSLFILKLFLNLRHFAFSQRFRDENFAALGASQRFIGNGVPQIRENCLFHHQFFLAGSAFPNSLFRLHPYASLLKRIRW